MKIAVAGASGFVGQALIERLSQSHEVIALRRARSLPGEVSSPNVEWRACDLFSLLQTEEALQGAEVAIYLVHSMLPAARLNQTSFEDADLLLADNFARAARKCGVRRILYLGGLIPPKEPDARRQLSRHLASRLEVERALGGRGAHLTVLRSGLILGAQGSSFQILYLLVRRLPVMLCPKWVNTRTQAIALVDVIALIEYCVNHEAATSDEIFDIGGPDIVTYRELMRQVAEQLGLHRRFFRVPFFTPGLSILWVTLITGASRNLISPLVESLAHEMVVRHSRLLDLYGMPLQTLPQALRECLRNASATLRGSTRRKRQSLISAKDVRSIQRLVLPPGRNAEWLAAEYFTWLPQFLAPFIRVSSTRPHQWDFHFRGLGAAVLTLTHSPERSTPDRQIFYITGGLLARIDLRRRGRLEFRETEGGALAAIHDFLPRLPWLIYKLTQAVAHLWVMKSFNTYLVTTK